MRFEKTLAFRIKLFTFFLNCVNFLRAVESFFLGGEECLCCGERCGIYPLCKSCAVSLENTPDVFRCRHCGKELVSEIDVCTSCREESVLKSVDFSYPLFSYRLWKKNLLFAWKTEEKRVLSPFFAKLVWKTLTKISPKNELLPVVPVPPRPGKIKQKGWDQIDELCFYLRNMYGVKVLPVLKRLTKYQQKKLNRKNRLDQIKKAYILQPENKIRKFLSNPPETVVLVDDVMTTGSTIEACAEELKKAGVKRVFVITLFIVD